MHHQVVWYHFPTPGAFLMVSIMFRIGDFIAVLPWDGEFVRYDWAIFNYRIVEQIEVHIVLNHANKKTMIPIGGINDFCHEY